MEKRARALGGLHALVILSLALFTVLSGPALAQSGTWTFHGVTEDQANKAVTTPGTATFDHTATTGTAPVTQTGSPLTNSDFVGNPLGINWSGPFSGAVSGVIALDWYWSTPNAVTAALGGTIEVSVFADPDYLSDNPEQPEKLIGRAIVPLLGITATPVKFTSYVAVSGTVNSTLLIQVVPQYVDTGNSLLVHYDSTLTPSGFHFEATNPTPQPKPAPRGSGLGPRFTNFTASPAQLASGLGNPSSTEPSIGVSSKTGKVFHQSVLETLRVSFADDCAASPSSSWENVAGPITGTETFDPILYTDSETGRTFVSQLLFPTTTSALAWTDDDGATWHPSQGAGIGSGVDHQGLGGGKFHAPIPAGATYPNAVYYCAQSIAEANCAVSLDGGTTFGPAVPIYAITECGGLHGHPKVGPDGTVYIPNKGCGDGQGVVVSENNGLTWTVREIPGSLPGGSDPSLAIDAGNRLWAGYAHNNNLAVVRYSDNHGATWSEPVDVGAQFGIKNVVFPAMVAGDAGRAAFVFVGTTVTGDLEAPSFDGIWHLYVATTYDGGASWITVDATPNDPVQRGCIWLGGGGNICRNLLDFMDATIDAQGRILVGYGDGCTGACAQAGASATGNAYGGVATIARQTGGRRLRAAFDPAEPTAPGAPNLTVTRNGGTARLSWSEGNDGGSPVTAYKVYRGTSPGQATTLLASAGTATSYTDTNADASKTYYYKVTATNSLGASCGSNEKEAVSIGSSCGAGVTVLHDAAGDQTGAPLNPALDVSSVAIAEPYQADGSSKLVFKLKVADLATLPKNAQWRVLWNSPDAPSGQFYVGMQTDAGGAVSYEYGTVDAVDAVATSVGLYTTGGPADAASGYTPDGTITLVVANDLVAAPKAGDLIGGVIARTYLGAGTVATTYRVATDTTDGNSVPYMLVGNAACKPAASATCVEDDDASINYTNGWHLVADPNASAGHFRYAAGKAKATVTVNVPAGQTGSITYHYATAPKAGSATVTLDGAAQAPISYAGTNGSTKAPAYGGSVTYGGLAAGTHTLVIDAQGGAYVDKFCLTSSASTGAPAAGPGTTSGTSGTIAAAKELVQSIAVPAGAQAISIVAQSSVTAPLQLVLVDPKGVSLQTVSFVNGIATLDRSITSGGTYLVKVLNVGTGAVQVWTLATPYVKR